MKQQFLFRYFSLKTSMKNRFDFSVWDSKLDLATDLHKTQEITQQLADQLNEFNNK